MIGITKNTGLKLNWTEVEQNWNRCNKNRIVLVENTQLDYRSLEQYVWSFSSFFISLLSNLKRLSFVQTRCRDKFCTLVWEVHLFLAYPLPFDAAFMFHDDITMHHHPWNCLSKFSTSDALWSSTQSRIWQKSDLQIPDFCTGISSIFFSEYKERERERLEWNS